MMQRKKICFIVPEYRADTPTHFLYLFEMIALLSAEFQIRCIIERSNGAPSLPDNVEIYAQQKAPLLFRLARTKINIMRARLSGYRHFYVHYSFFSAFFASAMTRLIGGKVFYWNCGLPWLYKRNWFRERFERLTYYIINRLVTGTEGLKRDYATHYRIPLEKISVLPNWIDIQKFKNQRSKIKQGDLKKQLNIHQEAKILLFAHKLSQRKGAHHLPEIMNQLRDENIILLVIGDGAEKENINLKIRELRLEHKIRFLGWVPQAQIASYFEASHVFIMPSEEEGFPHVLLEAMATGTPFVAMRVGGVTDMVPVELQEYTVIQGNIETFIDKIRNILHTSETRIKISQREQEWVKRYDINNIVRGFKEILE